MKFAILLLLFSIVSPNSKTSSEWYILENKLQENRKSAAFKILTTKCNVCHATKKRTDVFTLQNMDSLAADINKQVFIKKKMPKGRKVKLTNEESTALKAWINTLLQ